MADSFMSYKGVMLCSRPPNVQPAEKVLEYVRPHSSPTAHPP